MEPIYSLYVHPREHIPHLLPANLPVCLRNLKFRKTWNAAMLRQLQLAMCGYIIALVKSVLP